MNFFDIINVPLGYLFKGIYLVVKNYGFTIILFTLAIKVLLLPLNIKQQKSMKKMQALQPRLAKIQEKYAQDKEKQSMETMKLYQEAGVSPMGGCLPMLLQLPILFALYNIIRRPLSYIAMMGKDQIAEIAAKHPIEEGTAALSQLELAKLENIINFDFFGFDLSIIPNLTSVYVVIPLLAGATTYLVSVISSKISGSGNNNAAGNMKMMNVIFPLMTAWFSISLPAGLGLYWIVSNLFQIAQMFFLNKILKVDTSFASVDEVHFRERKKKKKK